MRNADARNRRARPSRRTYDLRRWQGEAGPGGIRALAAEQGEGRVEDDEGRGRARAADPGGGAHRHIGGWERLQSSSVAVMSLICAGCTWSSPSSSTLEPRPAAGLRLARGDPGDLLHHGGPGWFARSKDGLDSPALPEDMLGLLTLILVPVQILLIVVAMIAFNQEWHVEEERPIGGARLPARTMGRPPRQPHPKPSPRTGSFAPRGARSGAGRPRARR